MPAASFSPLAGLRPPFVLLEDRLTAGALARLYRDPVTIVRADQASDVPAAMDALEAGLERGLHVAGFMAYELGHVLEPTLLARMPKTRSGPLLWFGLFPAPTLINPSDLDAALAALGPPPPITDLRPGHDRSAHVDKVRTILEWIAAGDVYQVNLTFPLHFAYHGEPLRLYGALRAAQPVAHGGIAALEETTILSVSPELFVEAQGRQARVRPMKGTAARGATPDEDAALLQALADDPKQRAENLMIVDLLRNDLSRVSRPGAVRTPALFTAETYPSFHTLTSTVTAELRSDVLLGDLIAALFPCGSIVGAPKIRAAEVIGDLEDDARGVYTGAIGAIAPSWDLAFNVAIRTAVIQANGQGRYGVGGGVVADSDPDAEYDEALLKGRVLMALSEDYGLIETFRWSHRAGFVRLDRHLGRLEASANQLGFAVSRSDVEVRLEALAKVWAIDVQDRRVRLELSRSGAIQITDQAIPAASQGSVTVGVATVRLDAGDPFLRHKTTWRAVYENAFAQAQVGGWDEALLLNRQGLVADGSRNSVFVERDGGLVTPAIAHGALPGVLRGELIAAGLAVEGEVSPDDLRAGGRWFIGNSLHGQRSATLRA